MIGLGNTPGFCKMDYREGMHELNVKWCRLQGHMQTFPEIYAAGQVFESAASQDLGLLYIVLVSAQLQIFARRPQILPCGQHHIMEVQASRLRSLWL